MKNNTKRIELFDGFWLDVDTFEEKQYIKWGKPEDWDFEKQRHFLFNDEEFMKPLEIHESYFYLTDPSKEYRVKVTNEVDTRASCEKVSQKEKNFANCPEEVRCVIPEFKGIKMNEHGELYMSIENLMGGMKMPAILDIKIGTRSYDPFATKKKVDTVSVKFLKRKEFGFRIVGMQVYKDKDTVIKREKNWGRKMTNWNDDIEGDVISAFVSLMSDKQKEKLVEEMERIIDVWEKNATKRILIFSSSILVMYECADHFGEPTPCPDAINVKVMDFAHSFYKKDHPNVDDGVLHGLKQVKRAFHNVLGKSHAKNHEL